MAFRDRRLENLYSALSAQERAHLILQAIKAEQDADPAVRRTMPETQYPQFNHLMTRIGAVNHDLAILLMVLELHLETLDTKFAWLLTAHLWAMHNDRVREYLWVYSNETITEHEYAEKLAAARNELVPVDDLAEILVERYEDWQPDDLDPEHPGVGTDAAWDRVWAEKRRALVQLVHAGTIAGKRTRRGYVAHQGSFYDWLGELTPVEPEWGLHYTVVPDEQAEAIRGEQAARQELKAHLADGPQGLLPAEIGVDSTKTWEAVPRNLPRSLRAGILGE
jgi:hypothetical protein